MRCTQCCFKSAEKSFSCKPNQSMQLPDHCACCYKLHFTFCCNMLSHAFVLSGASTSTVQGQKTLLRLILQVLWVCLNNHVCQNPSEGPTLTHPALLHWHSMVNEWCWLSDGVIHLLWRRWVFCLLLFVSTSLFLKSELLCWTPSLMGLEKNGNRHPKQIILLCLPTRGVSFTCYKIDRACTMFTPNEVMWISMNISKSCSVGRNNLIRYIYYSTNSKAGTLTQIKI